MTNIEIDRRVQELELEWRELLKYYIIDKSGNRQYKKYCDCGKMIAYASKRCRRCSGKQRTKLNNEKRKEEAGL